MGLGRRAGFVRSGALALALAVPCAACSDPAKTSETRAAEHAASLAKLVTSDVEQVRSGLPAGAARLGTSAFAGDKPAEGTSLKSAMRKTRDAVPSLQLAKSTFFAVTDTGGLVLASDQDPERLAGKSLGAEAHTVIEAAGGTYSEGVADVAETRGVRDGDDATWVAATPVRAGGVAEGAVKAIYVSGWSLRQYAYHLEQQLKTDLRYAGAGGDAKATAPIVYAFVVVGGRVFGAPVTPLVDAEAVKGLNVGEKLKGSPAWHGRLELTGRDFGAAAVSAPSLAPGAAVVVIRSEV